MKNIIIESLIEYCSNCLTSEELAKIADKPESEELSILLGNLQKSWESLECDAEGETPEQEEASDALFAECAEEIIKLK